MQQQDNDFPIDQIKTGANPPDGGLAGGTTFQPQATAQSSSTPEPAPPPTVPTPNWQQTAASDVSELYAQPAPTTPQPIAPVASIPEASTTPGIAASTPEPGQAPIAMQQDFSQAGQVSAPSPAPQPIDTSFAPPQDMNQSAVPMPATTPTEPPPIMPAQAMPPAPTDISTMPTAMTEPTVPMPSNPLMSAPEPAPMPGLPGADQLGQAAVGMDQSSMSHPVGGLDPNMAGVDPLAANMEGMGAYGPPPNSKKKLLFIIGGAVLGIVIIGVVIFVITRSTARKPAQNLNPTTEQPTTPTEPTPTPSSGPATPPQGYVTIDKQCYSFALFDPNTVPADQACSFKDATFGKLKTSKISVISTTEAYKNLDEFVNTIKPTLTVTSEESIKLDNFDAKQLIYKASDGKTYSRVLALIVGKSYQQDGKAVTGIDITTSYQEDFDKTVTKNVLDTWRWK